MVRRMFWETRFGDELYRLLLSAKSTVIFHRLKKGLPIESSEHETMKDFYNWLAAESGLSQAAYDHILSFVNSDARRE